MPSPPAAERASSGASQEPLNDPWPIQKWAEVAPPDATTNEILVACQHDIRQGLEWGAEHAATATTDQRRKVLSAVVLLETGGIYTGVETIATLPGDDRELRIAQALRARLEQMSGPTLVEECRRVRHEAIAQQHGFATFLADIGKEASEKARALVSRRYWYRPAIIEFARHFRNQGSHKAEAIKEIAKEPYQCSDGTTVSVVGGKAATRDDIIVKQGGREQVISYTQLEKAYWPRAK